MKKRVVIFLILSALLIPTAYASIGVGVGVGKIQVTEQLKPGEIYQLPPITVLNTGTQPSSYALRIQHQEKQLEVIPDTSWFHFSPQQFTLNPHQVQTVQITLDLPIHATPGDYFAYLEAYPLQITPAGTTAVDIAAATKLYFTIIPATLVAAIYYKVLSFWNVYAPWPQIVLIGVIIIVALVLLKRSVNIEIKLAKKGIPKWFTIGAIVLFFIGYLIFWIKFFHLF